MNRTQIIDFVEKNIEKVDEYKDTISYEVDFTPLGVYLISTKAGIKLSKTKAINDFKINIEEYHRYINSKLR